MSATLVYRLPAKEHSLDDGLKLILRDTLFENGSGWIELSDKHVSFLEGIKAASQFEDLKKDAQKVIDLIEKHGSIEVTLKY